MHALIESAIAGDVRALGKALSVIEDSTPEVTQLLAGIPEAGNAQIIGITGPPGVGKSPAIALSIKACMRHRPKELG